MDEAKRWDFSNLQTEQPAWQKHNFPGRSAWMPLLGIVEEICDEWTTATEDSDVLDAVADTAIFMSDFCSALGINLQELYEEYEGHIGEDGVIPAVGRLAHSFLKMEQGIRGSRTEHMESIRRNLGSILCSLRESALCLNHDLLELVREVWSEVRKRDFKADPLRGGITTP